MARSAPSISVLPTPPDRYDPHYMYELVRTLEIALDDLKSKEFVQGGWSLTTANLTTTRAVALTSVSDAGNYIGTLINDLIKKGVLDGV